MTTLPPHPIWRLLRDVVRGLVTIAALGLVLRHDAGEHVLPHLDVLDLVQLLLIGTAGDQWTRIVTRWREASEG